MSNQWILQGTNWLGDTGILTLLSQHVAYSAVALAISGLIGFPIGCYTGYTGKGEASLISIANALRSLPSLGLLVLLVIMLSSAFESDMAFYVPCTIVLVILGSPSVILGTHAGISSIDPSVTDAARGMGLSGRQYLLGVAIPCALPLILTGFRNASLQIISTATIVAYVSLGGLGRLILDGLSVGDYNKMFAGAILVAILALIIDLIYVLLAQILVSPGVRRRHLHTFSNKNAKEPT
ncbi:Glycine betaine ABC transport system permease protein [Paraburkholderia caribensis MBA4]|uniref:Glycine betaine ABC transport system permease protein n=1 Tax=Paraburkholderia caribensis MBA4 TaxID=1323664 RepID=A0A0P0RIE8_9BURK|nr:ABC transporter permease subunit [Paraburkholderia caribensis]ALL68254.1 Glycine betaine ABC transport system permease protein [Paraburkholderia caribensis MBA4]